ncbi:chromosome segregation protein SMC [Bacillus sp. FJAT-42376]|uniref:chromosome segregation protein SMC n=1 Tax=Bacillus sp. FJAT-42376 TaxID=2014076 RepID=UPI000F4DD2C2|nr:chromosome segregation protein SMC [Bacillus sp. FJAT-42376]AZB42910.1 chromosome segregation protein SMC [Bacillus sp. FJAT-42376]
MFLKRLDIAGFKSFADRASVDFVKGVTAVVGPNGSGKSNITDAVRWVLGEQSAKSLRGGKMEDIIFAGSDSRRGVNLAEVTLTLDNEDHFLPIDYHEVSITRKVFRSGESEYYINKQSCRLKDIVDLFMDSGLGKEAFSIISQGKVEEILSSKAEERRSIFEEAAGVLKYKTRKKKAEHKLTETQDNLNRVQDILYELEGQVEPLKVQASIAKDYLEKKEELEQIEVALTVHDIEELHKKWSSLTSSAEKGQEKEAELAQSVQAQELAIKESRTRIAGLDETIDRLQQLLLQTSEELEKLEGKKEVLKERRKNAQANRGQLEQLIQELTVKIDVLKKDLQAEEEKVVTLSAEMKEAKQLVKEKQMLLEAMNGNIDHDIELLKSEYFEVVNQQTSAKNESAYIMEQQRQQSVKNERVSDSNSKYLQERQILSEKKEKLQEELSVLEAKMDGQIGAFRDAQKKLESDKETYAKKESALYKAYQFLQQTRTRKEMLESMQEDYSGFFQGVKEILKARDRFPGIHGAIAELIKTKKEYETAMEIALGAASQHIVTDDEQTARTAIGFLKKNSYGRATFLPLSIMKSRKIGNADKMKLMEQPSFLGIASELAEYDSRYSSVIENLLGAVVVARDLKGANELSRLLQFRYRIVTLEGDVVNPGGSMTGGAVKQKTGSLLSRNREMEAITGQLKEMEAKTGQLEQQVKEMKLAIQEQEKLAESLRREGDELRTSLNTVQQAVKEAEWEVKNVNDHLTIYDAEKESFDQEQQRNETRLKELNTVMEKAGAKLEEMDKEISRLSALKNSQAESKASLQQELTDLKIILAGKQQSFENVAEKAGRLKEELEGSTGRLQEATEDLSLLTTEVTSNTSGEQTLSSASAEKLNEKNKTIEMIAEKRTERSDLQQALEKMELDLKESSRLYKQMADWLKDEELKITRLGIELDTKLNHLREEYLLTFERAKERYELTLEPEEARRKVRLIKRGIDELGTVNLGAIDEHERVSERYQFLHDQREDLLEAKDTLHQVIDEMDEEMKRRFSTTFDQIRAHFETVFQALFGGGRAELRLSNPEDLLNTGVDIVAQPPGKKLQHLSLLSGGERALTAIALLFSILKVRPVPFCILDEVEAALDEANVFRFAQYLKKFSEQTQFIVITHRKGTMEECDVLYGVTMQESGVSKLVSVRLDDTKEFAAVK